MSKSQAEQVAQALDLLQIELPSGQQLNEV